MEEELRHREIDIPGGVTLLLGNHQPSFTAVLRAVKRAEHSILNCIASIVHDYEFVSDVAGAFTPFPLLPNLRCGGWYAAVPTDNCYFKSTDGHSGEWSFSTARLNLHVAQIAAQHGGVCIVDATRRGKTFPDALTKTIPIWATVINRAVAKLKLNTSSASSAATAAAIDNNNKNTESLDLCLPHWISKNEKNQIEQRIDTWVEELLALGVASSLVAATLKKKPLRCIWVSQEQDIEKELDDWLEIAENEELQSKYTLLVLISASIPNNRQRRRLVIDSTLKLSDDSSDSSTSKDDEDHSSSNATINYSDLVFNQPIDLVYDYIPGAGDDEESWAKGLTPSLMWENIEELLRSGPENVGNLVEKLVKSKMMSARAEKRTGAGARVINGRSTSGSNASWKVEWIGECVGIGISTSLPLLERQINEKDGVVAILDVGCTSCFSSCTAEMEGDNANSGRYLHLPIAGDKNLKRAVLHSVPAAVKFASNHLSSSCSSRSPPSENKLMNKILVVAEPEAIDIAASVALAILLACFTINDEDRKFAWKKPAVFFPESTTQLISASSASTTTSCESAAALQDQDTLTVNPGSITSTNKNRNSTLFSRATVRQYFSMLSMQYPQVVLSKSLLKQVYNAFLKDSMVRIE